MGGSLSGNTQIHLRPFLSLWRLALKILLHPFPHFCWQRNISSERSTFATRMFSDAAKVTFPAHLDTGCKWNGWDRECKCNPYRTVNLLSVRRRNMKKRNFNIESNPVWGWILILVRSICIKGNVMIGYKDCWRGVGGWWVAHNIRIFLKNMYLFENVTEFQNIIV